MQSRYFNSVRIINENTLRKSSTDTHKLEAEYNWYNNELNKDTAYLYNTVLPISVCTPVVYNLIKTETECSYDIDYIHGFTLAYHFLDGDLNTELMKGFIDSLYNVVNNSKIVNITDYNKMIIQSMYADKTYERLAKTDIDLDSSYIINDYHTPTIREIIEDCPVYISDNDIRRVHGDLCLSNIIYYESINRYNLRRLYLIDPRGCLSDGKFSNIGDVKYDVAKLAHSFVGRYDQIKADEFKVEKIGDHNYTWSCRSTEQQSELEKYFKDKFRKFDYYNIMIHLFLSMIPLHKDNPKHQEAMLVNALRLYLERDK